MFKSVVILVCFFTLSSSALDIGDSVPQHIQKSLKLKPHKVYVIDFFASWCHSCEKELPLVSKLYQNKHLNIIGINEDKKMAEGKEFVKRLNLTFPVHYDTTQTLIRTFSPQGFPTLYFIKDGEILDIVVGAKNHIDNVIVKKVKQCQ